MQSAEYNYTGTKPTDVYFGCQDLWAISIFELSFALSKFLRDFYRHTSPTAKSYSLDCFLSADELLRHNIIGLFICVRN